MKRDEIILPKKAKTLGDKIRKSNPWQEGESLAKVVEENFQSIVDCPVSYGHEWLADWCRIYKLAPSWVFTTLKDISRGRY